jgi:CheY-like chemotaxis protein
MRILLADDNPDEVFLFREALKILGVDATVEDVADGPAVLECCTAHGCNYDVIVLDFYLPKMDAEEVVAQLKSAGILQQTPLVVISSHVSARQAQRLKDLGVAMVTEKASDLDGLCLLVKRILDLRTGFAAAAVP